MTKPIAKLREDVVKAAMRLHKANELVRAHCTVLCCKTCALERACAALAERSKK